jgi:oxygen-dependent protoporphyrinogen oxidase
MKRLVVVGGGISGLAAAVQAIEFDAAIDVVVLEASPRVGGKLAVGSVGGLVVDLGAESLLCTRPEAVDLAIAAGLADRIVHPAVSQASVLSRGELRPLPGGLVMGLPSDADAVAASGVLDAAAVERLREGLASTIAADHHDRGLGEFAAAHAGPEVAARLVDPVVSGVYAGDATAISMAAAAPSLAAAVAAGGRFDEVLARASRRPDGPVFAGIDGGVGTLPDAVRRLLDDRGASIRTGCAAISLTPTRDGRWRVGTAATDEERARDAQVRTGTLTADAVVLAVPASAASALLSTLPPGATPSAAFDAMRMLDAVPYADVAVATFALPMGPGFAPPSGSGFLVPTVERLDIKAATFSSTKWAWTRRDGEAAGRYLLRASLGRFGASVEHLLDTDLIERAWGDLSRLRPDLPAPVDARLDRWPQGLPQYLVGHVDTVAAIRSALEPLPPLAVAGAAYDGVGIAACVASGREAAQALVGQAAQR